MISRIRNYTFTKLFWGLMGLYLLNISVDTVDLYPEHIPEDLSINDQESIVEIIVEQVLGYENAIQEYDDHDTDGHSKKNVKIDVLVQPTLANEGSYKRTERKQLFLGYEAHLTNGHKEIKSPPPKV
ncbi:MAG: hypothetical protein ABJH04_10015 [Cyclobacteriaceae bacterium]